MAILNFLDEYGNLPLPGEMTESGKDVEIVTDTPEGIALLTVLMGMEKESSEMLNPKKIRFVDLPEGKHTKDGGRNGIIYDSDGRILGLYDPWGHPYHIIIDVDGNKVMNLDGFIFPKEKNGGQNGDGQRVVVYSHGRNEKDERGNGDDVVSR